MQAEVIAIGDELVFGQRVDTNSAWLSEQLAQLGLAVRFHTTVGDDVDALNDALRLALSRSGVVVSTGGLGPTADDLTRQALATVAGRPLLRDESVLRHIEALFARRGRPMPSANEIQAMFPEGSRVIPNPHGTAPGIDLEVPGAGGWSARVFALPGVPAEMHEMWNATVEPRLRQMGAGSRIIRHRRLKCFGVGESELERMLPDLIARGRSPSVGITVHKATITLTITADGESKEACDQAMHATIDTIRRCLGSLVYGEEDDELHHVVTRLLRARAETLSTAEWGTDGLIAYWIRGTADASRVYGGGIVVASAGALGKSLGIQARADLGTDESCAHVAGQMAQCIRRQMDTDHALAVGPRPDSDATRAEPPVIHIARANSEGVSLVRQPFAGHPDILLERSAKQALDYLRLYLANRPK
jgi:nicotinamide-nucleotide amidase